jgi:type I restriction enzyme S subunit
VAANFKPYVLGELGRIITGKTPPTVRLELFGSDFPFITPVDMHDVKFTRVAERYLSKEGAEFQSRYLIPAGSVAVSCIGWQMGKSILVSRPSFTNQQLNTIIPHDWVDSDFLYYALTFKRKDLFNIGSGTGVRTPIMNKTAFSEFKILLPEFNEQRRIAAILSAYDDLIENNTRRIAVLEEMARRIYEEWFVHFRYPGHEQAQKVETELGLVPEGWELKKLGDVANVNASSIKRGNQPDEVLYVDIASVGTGSINDKQAFKFEDAPGRARRLVADGDVIWSCVRPNRRSYALVQNPESNLVVSTGFAVLSPTEVPFSFLFYAVTTDAFVGYLVNAATGAAYPAVNSGDFESASILIPPTDLMAKFHDAVEPMMRLSESLRDKNANLRQTRDLLLPRLISGELDVSTLVLPDAA